MGRKITCVCAAILLLSLCGCSGFETAASDTEQIAVDQENEMEISIPQTGMTEFVPSSYKAPASRQGSIERVDYESLDYARDSASLTKTAYVYLPYGYDEADSDTRYDIIYLMHGMGGHAGEYFDYTPTKNMFDNLIENGDIPPVIIVSATFYNENSNTDFSGSIGEFRVFHSDFENHLIRALNKEQRFFVAFEDFTYEQAENMIMSMHQ